MLAMRTAILILVACSFSFAQHLWRYPSYRPSYKPIRVFGARIHIGRQSVRRTEVSHMLCCNQTWSVEATTSQGCCNGELYNLENKICCEDALHDIPGRNPVHEYGCCKNESYNIFQQSCCNGKVFPVQSSKSGCCNGVAYDKSENLCCNNQIIPGFGRQSRCCNSTVFDRTKAVCCNGQIFPHAAHSHSKLFRCCAGKAIDRMRELCCNGTAIKKTSRYDKCCTNATSGQGVAFNYAQDLCCNGNIHKGKSRYNGHHCCGAEAYHPGAKGQHCCGGSLVQVPPAAKAAVHYLACCGTQTYNVQNQHCCAGHVHAKTFQYVSCCGNLTINAQTSTCCGGNVVHEGHGLSCCGKEKWDTTKDVCCDNKLFPRNNITHDCSMHCEATPKVHRGHVAYNIVYGNLG